MVMISELVVPNLKKQSHNSLVGAGGRCLQHTASHSSLIREEVKKIHRPNIAD
jgi:hypothetical protein